jgi:hypothetical protein
MKKQLSRPARLVCAIMACAVLLCGLTACGTDEATPEATEPVSTAAPPQEPVKPALYPADVQTVTEGDGRQIIKTYRLADDESPADIPRDSFESDGWRYELADVTRNETGGTDARQHTETVEIDTQSDDLAEIIAQLSPELEYESEDGYCGVLTLDLASVECEAAGYENSSYAVTVTREYADLPANDLAYIPKTVTDNGRALALDSVEWAAQSSVNVGYTDIPDSYRATAKYVGTASQRVATGYVTTADYTGEIAKTVEGETVYTAYFTGTEISADPPVDSGEGIVESEKDDERPPDAQLSTINYSLFTIISAAVVIVLLAGAAVYFFFLRHNVKVYSVGEDGSRTLIAKVRISAKNPVIDLTPLGNRPDSRFLLEIDRLAAKALNGKAVEVIFGSAKLGCPVAYEGNAYRIEANFRDQTIKAIY